MSNLWENFSPWTYEGSANSYKAVEDGYAKGAQTLISFYHLPSAREVYFKAFITAFTETTSPNWNSETIYGRTDPVQIFKNTTRRVSLAFKIPAATIGEAYENLAKVQLLVQFLYPTYIEHSSTFEAGVNHRTITQSPFIRLKVMNLLASTAGKGGTAGASADQLFDEYGKQNEAAAEFGQLGLLHNVSINHNLENADAGGGALEKTQNTILPKLLEVNLDFSPIHEQTLGWHSLGRDEDERPTVAFIDESIFPYGAVTEEAAQHQVTLLGTATGVPEEMTAGDEVLPTGDGSDSTIEDQQELQRQADVAAILAEEERIRANEEAYHQRMSENTKTTADYLDSLGTKGRGGGNSDYGAPDGSEKPEGTLPVWDD